MTKPKVIHIEGANKVGKTSVLKELWKQRGCVDILLDRSVISAIAYNGFYKRKVDVKEYHRLIEDRDYNIVVLLICDRDLLQSRLDNKESSQFTASNELRMFWKEFNNLKKLYNSVKFIVVDTTNQTPKESAQEVNDKIGDERSYI